LRRSPKIGLGVKLNSAHFKSKVAFERIKGMAGIFVDKPSAAVTSSEIDRLHAKIGQLLVERYFYEMPLFSWT
jgi:hypothetical protein